MKYHFLPLLLSSCVLAACSMQSSENRAATREEELASLDSPDVPTFEESLEKNASDALKAGNNPNALALYEQLYDRDPEKVEYHLGLAEALRKLGDNDKAIEFYDKVLAKHAGHLDAHEGKGLALMADGRTEEAAQLFGRIIQRDPARWRTLNALGILFAIKNMPKEGIAYMDEALKHKPNNPAILNNIGLTHAINQDYRSAEQSLRNAAQNAENDQKRQIELNLAMVYGVSGSPEQAREISQRYLSGPSLDNNLGLYAYLSNNKELAKSYLNMALTNSEVYYDRAWQNLDIINGEAADDNKSDDNAQRLKIQ